MKELTNGKGVTTVFALGWAPSTTTALSMFVHYDMISIFSFYIEDDVDKIFLIDMKNFTTPNGINEYERKSWNLETILETYQELVDMGIIDNVLIKVLNSRSRAWDYWSCYFDLTDASEEDITMVLIRWKGIVYDRKENRSL